MSGATHSTSMLILILFSQLAIELYYDERKESPERSWRYSACTPSIRSIPNRVAHRGAAGSAELIITPYDPAEKQLPM